MTYDIEIYKAAAKVLYRLDRTTAKRIEDRIEELARQPYFERFSKPLKMAPEKRSSRVGQWRIIYQVHETDRKIIILAVRPRQTAYQDI